MMKRDDQNNSLFFLIRVRKNKKKTIKKAQLLAKLSSKINWIVNSIGRVRGF